MSESAFFIVMQNITFLLSMGIIFDITLRSWQTSNRWRRRAILGVIVGTIGIILMGAPWITTENLRIDTRSILLSVSGLFFGFLPTAIAMIMTSIYRLILGGAVFTGIMLIVLTGMLGILWRWLRKNSLLNLKWWQLYIFGIIVHLVMIINAFTQPVDIAIITIKRIFVPVMVIYPIAATLLGMLMLNRLRREKDAEDLHRNQARLMTMVDILQYPTESIQTFVDFAMEEAIKLTESKLGFIFYYSEETKIFTLSAWSKDAMEACKILEPQTKYELDKTGLWGEPVRQRKAIIINDFQAPNPLKKGYPEGHPQLTRLLEVPVFIENQIVAVVGVADKNSEYTDIDTVELNLLMEMVWKTTERKRAIEALKVSEENYRALFDQSADGILIFDQENDYLEINASACRILGFTHNELQHEFRKFLVDSNGTFNPENEIGQLKTGKTILTEHKLKNKQGDNVDLEILTQLLPDGRVQKIFRDISERKRAEEKILQTQTELQRLLTLSDDSRKALLSVIEDQKEIEEALRKSEKSYRNLFENITQGFGLHKMILDDNGRPMDYQFLAANPAFEELSGLNIDEILGKTAREVLPNLEQSWIDLYGEVAMTGEPKRFENYTATLNKYFDVTAFCPEPGYFAVIISDVTERKKYEQEIQKLNLELEERVKQRTAELENANKELESFSYSVSHDLRAPLRSIHGFSQIILDEYASNFAPDVSHYFDLIRKNATMMGNLVDDLLNFSRLGRQSLTMVTINPEKTIREVIELMQTDISQYHVDIKINPMPDCKADASLIKQVYVNLISNAIKFSKEKPTPCIEMGFLEQSDDQKNGSACYYVKDNGVGFDMKFYDKLFGVFQRLHRAEDYEGTGVGLAIVQRIIKKHGGSIWADSIVGEGTTFYFTMGEPKNG